MPLVQVTEITNISRQTVSVAYDQIDASQSATNIDPRSSGFLSITPGSTETVESNRLQSIERLQQLNLIRVVVRNASAAPPIPPEIVPSSETLIPTIIDDLGDKSYGPWSNLSSESLSEVDGNVGSTPYGTGSGGNIIAIEFKFNGSTFGLTAIAFNEAARPGILEVSEASMPFLPETLEQLTKESFNDTFGFTAEITDTNSGLDANTLFFRGFKPTFPRPNITGISFSLTWGVTATPTFFFDQVNMTLQYA